MDKSNLVQKVKDLKQKVNRLNKERNELLRSNKKMVQLLVALEEVINHSDPSDQYNQRHEPTMSASNPIDLDHINEQAMAIQRRLDELSQRNT